MSPHVESLMSLPKRLNYPPWDAIADASPGDAALFLCEYWQCLRYLDVFRNHSHAGIIDGALSTAMDSVSRTSKKLDDLIIKFFQNTWSIAVSSFFGYNL